MRVTEKDLINRTKVLEKELNLGPNIGLNIYQAYGRKQIQVETKKSFRHIEDLTYLGSKREIYYEVNSMIRALRLYKKRVQVKRKYKNK
tara:strand:+ start:1355 stop:1621 length:267 start_codon:yes stop_codon:yes gene_type:complete